MFGKTVEQHGFRWYEYMQFIRERVTSKLLVAFGEVATHNHFVLDRGGKVFKQTAPVIKLPSEATEDDHLALLGLLNSSTACFWLKQVCHQKQMMGGDGVFVPELLEMAGPQLEGAIVTTGVTTDAPEFAEFNKAFEAKHGVQANIYTYYGLDALMAIEYAIGEAAKKGEVTPTAVRDALETMKDVQLFTSKVTMEPDTHNPHNKPLLIMTIKDSKWELTETFQPQ